MRRYGPFVLVAIASLSVGFVIGQGRARKPQAVAPAPPIWELPIQVHEPVPGPPPYTSRKIHALEPFAVHQGDLKHRFADPPNEQAIWVLNLDGGRVRVFCAARD